MREAPLPTNRHERLTSVLERYISRSTVIAMLRTVLAERGISPERMTADELASVVEEVMVGLRLFCSPRRLPDLMIELAELCDREASEVELEEQRPTPPSTLRAAKMT